MICLDFDGVIADSLPLWLAIFRAAAAHFSVDITGCPQPYDKLRPLTFERLAETLNVDPRAFAEKMAQLALADDQVAPLIPGIDAALTALATLAPLTIVSSSRPAVIQRFIEQHKLGRLFCAVHGSGDGRGKSEVLMALRDRGAFLMIGDAASDIDAAQAAGIAAIGVTWGWQDLEMISHADMIITNPNELFYAAAHLRDMIKPNEYDRSFHIK